MSTATIQFKQQLVLMRQDITPNYLWTRTLRDISSQWFAGKKNNLTDALSQDWHRNNSKLTSIFCFHFLKKVLEYFEISLLPNKISSWLISLLQ
jgi:hypothetical protein